MSFSLDNEFVCRMFQIPIPIDEQKHCIQKPYLSVIAHVIIAAIIGNDFSPRKLSCIFCFLFPFS